MTVYSYGIQYCVHDGAPLKSRSGVANQCVKCGQVYPTGTNFCPSDGGQVRAQLLHQQRNVSNPPMTLINVDRRVQYKKANFGDRLLALIIDFIITITLGIPAIVTLFSMGLNVFKGDLSEILATLGVSVLLFLIPMYYDFFKDGFGQGQSWGKAAMGLMVVILENNSPCRKRRAFLRSNVSILIALIPYVGWLVDLLMVIITVDGRKIGDLAANTQVIHKKDYVQ
jgi:uncharacterized RDD family membrane protein YckC